MSAPLELFVDRGCPYAHRVLALLAHLGVDARVSEGPVGGPIPGLARYSRSGRVPLLVDGSLVIGESRVMMEHLAERHAMKHALPEGLAARTLHRHAMAIFDPQFGSRLLHETPLPTDRLEEVVDAIEVAARGAQPGSLLAFHLAPFWLRLRLWRPRNPITIALSARASLAAWLDAAAEHPAVAATFVAPEPLVVQALLRGDL